jgi:hypothetical protein
MHILKGVNEWGWEDASLFIVIPLKYKLEIPFRAVAVFLVGNGFAAIYAEAKP